MQKLGSLLAYALWALAIGGIAWLFYYIFEDDAEERELRARLARLMERERVALVYVDEVDQDGFRLRWQDVLRDDEGKTTVQGKVRTYRFPGDSFRVEAIQIRFSKEKVATDDPLRGRSLVLFSRLYSGKTAPDDGERLDLQDGDAPPEIYASQSAPGDFERALWRDFRRLASDRAYADEQGVDTAQFEAVGTYAEEGTFYEITRDREGGLTIRAADVPAIFKERMN